MPKIKHPTNRPYNLYELVNKRETSASNLRKRINCCKQKLRLVTKEQKRIARDTQLNAVNLTLTYANNKDFTPKHISRFINCLRSKLKRNGNSLMYSWTLELSNSLHYHLIVWLPHGVKLEKKHLVNWWPFGSTWVERCQNVLAWTRYISKFESKQNLPLGARVFSHGGLDEQGRDAVEQGTLPVWLKAVNPRAKFKRIPKVGWVDMSHGELYVTPWKWTPKGFMLKDAA